MDVPDNKTKTIKTKKISKTSGYKMNILKPVVILIHPYYSK